MTSSHHHPLDVAIATSTADLRRWNEVRNAGDPLDASPHEVLLDHARRHPDSRFLLGVRGRQVLAVGRGWKRQDAQRATIQLVRAEPSLAPAALTALAGELESWGEGTGAAGLSTYTYDTWPDMLRFWEERAWSEHERKPVVGVSPLEVTLDAARSNLEIVTLAERPELVRAVYDTYRESWTSAPWGSEVLPFERWWGNIERWPGASPDQFFVAVDSDEVLGYAELDFGAVNDRSWAWHGYTGVRPEHQGRGIATALKLHTLHWARARGVERLLGANDEENVAMRGINERLGYRHEFSYVTYRLEFARAR